MVIYLSINRGFSFRPFIFLPNWVKDTKEEAGYLTHEKVHYNRQWRFPLIWIIYYYLSKSFRWQEEKLAWAAQIKVNYGTGYEVTDRRYAEILSTQYRGMVNYEKAMKFIKTLPKENENEN